MKIKFLILVVLLAFVLSACGGNESEALKGELECYSAGVMVYKSKGTFTISGGFIEAETGDKIIPDGDTNCIRRYFD